jgi:hypothetical protein
MISVEQGGFEIVRSDTHSIDSGSEIIADGKRSQHLQGRRKGNAHDQFSSAAAPEAA